MAKKWKFGKNKNKKSLEKTGATEESHLDPVEEQDDMKHDENGSGSGSGMKPAGSDESLPPTAPLLHKSEQAENKTLKDDMSSFQSHDDGADLRTLSPHQLPSPQEPDQENSPIPQVAATVPVTDDPNLPCLTFRFWVLSTFFTVLSAATAQFYFFRANTISFSIFFVQLASYVLGKSMAKTLPTRKFKVPWFQWEFTMNPGPFNTKEHMLIGVAAGTSSFTAYAIDVISVQRLFYAQNLGWFADIMLLFTTQCLGYGMSGLLRSFLVKPAAMIWPSNLVQVALYQTLHEDEDLAGGYQLNKTEPDTALSPEETEDVPRSSAGRVTVSGDAYELNNPENASGFPVEEESSDETTGLRSPESQRHPASPTTRTQMTAWKIPKMRFFVYSSCFIFVWQLFPGYMAPVLASMTLLCWINPQSPVLQNLGSGYRGLGIGAISFDWNVIGSVGPLYTPWWAQVNLYIGLILMLWIITPIIYYTDMWDAKKFPIVSAGIFDNNGSHYNISRVLTKEHVLNETAYNEYSKLYMSPYFAVGYGISFLALTSTISHVLLWYGPSIWARLTSRNSQVDIHTKMMATYPEVPQTWYLGMFFGCLFMAMFVCEYYPIKLPWWALLLAVALAALLVLPIGIIQAISNTQIGLNVLTEFVCGYMLPGYPIANLVFKTYGYMSMSQCLLLVRDLKLGHYMKIPPRKMFIVQLFGTVCGSLVNYVVMNAIINSRDLLEIDPTGQWDPRASKIFFSASIIWGAIGPGRMFGVDSIYHPLLWFFLIGLMLPVPFFVLHKMFPNSPIKFHLINVPIIAMGASIVPQSPANFIISSFIISFIFQFYIYRYSRDWWNKYNYVLSAALDAGAAVSSMLVFLVTSALLQDPRFFSWWGNDPLDSERCTFGSMNNS